MRLYSKKGTTLKTGDGSAKKFLKICKVSFGLCAEAFLPFFNMLCYSQWGQKKSCGRLLMYKPETHLKSAGNFFGKKTESALFTAIHVVCIRKERLQQE